MLGGGGSPIGHMGTAWHVKCAEKLHAVWKLLIWSAVSPAEDSEVGGAKGGGGLPFATQYLSARELR